MRLLMYFCPFGIYSKHKFKTWKIELYNYYVTKLTTVTFISILFKEWVNHSHISSGQKCKDLLHFKTTKRQGQSIFPSCLQYFHTNPDTEVPFSVKLALSESVAAAVIASSVRPCSLPGWDSLRLVRAVLSTLLPSVEGACRMMPTPGIVSWLWSSTGATAVLLGADNDLCK